ncbi:MAG: alanine--tRNA ligase, partial [Bacteroidota bacterium]|nr:alanine--tRNA ligase [Bacteroidota bacterium]
MTSAEIRQSFLDFFRGKDHRIVDSAPVVPHDDPTLLFTNAGMNQFKDVFLGAGTREYTRAADTQKCIRVSGKHNDLEEVGRDTYHHTFFEMLGNWSFGDYYKREAISWAWELLTVVWKLPKQRLHATVYREDDEAFSLWTELTDIDPSHVHRFGEKDNFWEMGETGPCGPCSEIHIDLTENGDGGKLVNADSPEVMEIWNLVFIQYNRDADGTLHPLPMTHVDTGMGFERICAVLQGKKSNYDTDVFMPVINRIAEVTGQSYAGDATQIAMRVIADHVRMLTFSIADGAMPGPDGRGYVLRRILRRAARFGRNLGIRRDPFLWKVVATLADIMGDVFPEIVENRAVIEKVIRAEEESFNATLDRGLEIFEEIAARTKSVGAHTIPGEDVFRLYDTFGFPLDLTNLLAEERGLRIDSDGFDRLLQGQKERSRAVTKKNLVHSAAGEQADIPLTLLDGVEAVSRFTG